MSIRRLDVNVIMSLLDSAQVHHSVAVEWFNRTAANEGWSTPGLAAQSLAAFQAAFRGSFRFWADDVSLSDSTLFDLHSLTTSGQTTDAYLAGLAFRNSGRLATLDRGIQWRAVRGANAGLVERIVV
jgi:predicted nucleic acid-binding protein